MVQMGRSGAGTSVLRYSPAFVACYFGRPYNVSADALVVCIAQQFWMKGVSCAYWRIVIQSCVMPIMAHGTAVLDEGRIMCVLAHRAPILHHADHGARNR